MGYFDSDDALHVLGRISTLIKTESGEKIQTEDVEDAYAQESAIREIAVPEKKGKLVALIVPGGTAHGEEERDGVGRAVVAQPTNLPGDQLTWDIAIKRNSLLRPRLDKLHAE